MCVYNTQGVEELCKALLEKPKRLTELACVCVCVRVCTQGVEELCKALLEKPKRLTELAQRWWNEVFFGTCRFDRRERIVAALRSLTPADLLAFANETLAHPCLARKAVVAVQGNNAGRRTPDPTTTPTPTPTQADTTTTTTNSATMPQSVIQVTDIAEFKRGCSVWPSVGGLSARWKVQQGVSGQQGVVSVGAQQGAQQASGAQAAKL